MIYDLDSFDMFAHLAYYIHRGTLTAKLFSQGYSLYFFLIFAHL